MLSEVPYLGAGLGYRKELKQGILSGAEQIDFLELISDQFIDKPPIVEQQGRLLAEQFPLVLHGVDLSLGTDCPIDAEYVAKLRHLADIINPKWISDHLCFTRIPGASLAQLTPLAFTDASADVAIRNIKQMVATFDCPFLVENISYYFLIPLSTMTEAEFITRVIRESGGWLLLDLDNVLNNATNNHYDPFEFLDQIPLDRVVQLHLAGGVYRKNVLLDTHSHAIPEAVFQMLEYTSARMPALKGVIIERDQNYPPMEELLAELARTREILAKAGVHHNPLKTASTLPA